MEAGLGRTEPPSEEVPAGTISAAERRFRTLVEQSPVSTQIFAPDGTTLLVNRAWEALWGVTLDQIIGYNILRDPQLAERGVMPLITRAFAGEAQAIPPLKYVPEETIAAISSIPYRWVQAVIYPIKDDAGRVQEVILQHEDITDRVKAETALRRLQAVGDAALAHLDLDALLQDLLKRIRELLGADTAAILLLEPGDEALVVRAAQGLEGEVERGARIPVGVGFAGRVAAARRVLAVDDIDPAEGISSALRQRGIRALLGAPLVVDGRILGVVQVGSRQGHPFDVADGQLLQRVADRAALALERARLYDDAEQARRVAEAAAARSARLLAVTTSLTEALTPAAVAATIAEQALAALGAATALVAQLTDDGAGLEVVHAAGYPAAALDGWRRFPLDAPVPLAAAVRTGAVIWPEPASARVERYPHLAAGYAAHGQVAWLSLPLLLEGRAIGGLSLSFEAPPALTEDDRALLLALAGQCAQALERARLYEAERRARAEAEAVRTQLAQEAARAEALADASRAFAEARLELDAVLETVARRVVAILGDSCVIRLLSEDGRWLEPVALDHRDPEANAFRRALVTAAPQRSDEGLNGQVMRTGQPVLIPVVDQQALQAAIKPEYVPYLDRFATHSFLIVPLRVRGRALGVMGASRETPGRPYTPDDQGFLQELADRAAPAIENARLYRQAREAIRLREQFVSIASHELKTPLTSVGGYVELLGRQFARSAPDPGRVARYLALLQDQVGRLGLLVDDLLDASRIQQGRLTLRPVPCDLAALAREVAERLQHSREHTARHTLEVEAPVAVTGLWDRDRLDQILSNLISNALKYSPKGGVVRVQVALHDDREATVVVSDEGLGIPTEEQSSLFQPFVRASTLQESIGGTGLGLYIVRQIAETHGGTVALESEVGRGTTVTLRLPLAGTRPADDQEGSDER